MVLFLLTLNIFNTFFSFSVVDFEQVNVCRYYSINSFLLVIAVGPKQLANLVISDQKIIEIITLLNSPSKYLPVQIQ